MGKWIDLDRIFKSESVSHSVVSDSLWPQDFSPSASSVHGIIQAGILEWVAILFSRGSSWLRDLTLFSCIVGRFFTIWATRETQKLLFLDAFIWAWEPIFSWTFSLLLSPAHQLCVSTCWKPGFIKQHAPPREVKDLGPCLCGPNKGPISKPSERHFSKCSDPLYWEIIFTPNSNLIPTFKSFSNGLHP